MSVVPADELGGTENTLLVFAGEAELAIERRADRQDHGIVHLAKPIDIDVASDLDIAEVSDLQLGGGPIETAGNVLGGLMIGRHAIANEAVRRRQALDDVDLAIDSRLDQGVRRIEAARPGTDDRDCDRHSNVSPRPPPAFGSGYDSVRTRMHGRRIRPEHAGRIAV